MYRRKIPETEVRFYAPPDRKYGNEKIGKWHRNVEPKFEYYFAFRTGVADLLDSRWKENKYYSNSSGNCVPLNWILHLDGLIQSDFSLMKFFSSWNEGKIENYR